jgi:hypothetical protein
MKSILKNRKGTAEVIGTIMFIVILLFFFTNVYLWHDAATKDANQLNLKQINSTFKIEQTDGVLVVTANGGSHIVLSRLWIVEDTASGGNHLYADLGNVQVAAGESFNITFSNDVNYNNPPSPVTVTTLQAGSIQVNYYAPEQPVTCTVINALGVAESTTFQP